MNTVIKIAGLILIFSVCSAFGFMKSSNLKKRENYLEALIRCMEELGQRMRYDGSNKEKLINQTFVVENLFTFSGEKAVFPESYCDTDTENILCDFLNAFGKGDIESELKRVELCKLSLERRYLSSQKASSEMGKIYRTMGMSVGAVVCLLLI